MPGWFTVHHFRRDLDTFSSYLSANPMVLLKLTRVLHEDGIIHSGTKAEVLKKSSGQEKADYLMKSVDKVLTSSPETFSTVLGEMYKLEGLKDVVISVQRKVAKETEDAIDKYCDRMMRELEEFGERKRQESAMLDRQIEEVRKKAFGEKYDPNMKLSRPSRFPNAPDTTTEEQTEWLKSEFEDLNKKYDDLKESRITMKERIERGCQEINYMIVKSDAKLDREIADSLQRAKAMTETKLKDFEELILSNKDKELMSEAMEMYDSARKFNEESFDKYLEREREIDAIEKAFELQTFDVKIEKSYQCGLVPRWTRSSLSTTSYTVAPVYRTIEGFEQKKTKNEEIYTEPFYTTHQGYKLTLAVDPNGYGQRKGSHVSVYISLMKGDNDNVLMFPLTGTVIVQVLNWTEDNEHVESIIQFNESKPLFYRQRVTDGEIASVGLGRFDFLSHNDLEKYLHNDMMCFRVSFEPINQTGLLVPSWYTDDITSSIPPCTVTMDQYSLFKKTDNEWLSRPFYSNERGYKLQLRVDAKGRGSGRGTHVSVYVLLMKGEYDEELKWPFNANITIQLLNWTHDSDHIEETIPHHQASVEYRTRVIEGDVAPGSYGIELFISHSDLNDDNNDINYIHDDKLCFRVTNIDIIDKAS